MAGFFASFPSGGSSGSVTSLNGLQGALTLVAGSGITITPSGSTLIIAATGGGAFALQDLSNLTTPTAINTALVWAASPATIKSTTTGDGAIELRGSETGLFNNNSGVNTLKFFDVSQSKYISFQAPNSIGSPAAYTLPEDGAGGQVLSTDGAGTLSWITASGASPVGGDGAVQFSTSGAFNGNNTLLYTNGSGQLGVNTNSLNGYLTVSGANNQIAVKNGSQVFALQHDGANFQIVDQSAGVVAINVRLNPVVNAIDIHGAGDGVIDINGNLDLKANNILNPAQIKSDDASGATNSSAMLIKTGSVVDGTAGDLTLTAGLASGTGTSGNLNLNAAVLKINGSPGASGTFTTVDLKTVTVTNGIITSIV